MWSQEVARRGATRLTVLSTNESMSTTDPTPQNGTGDILPGVNAGASRTAGGIFAGLRHDLLSRVKHPALAVEQVCRWLCHTAVTPILAVRTRSYLLTHILRPVAIRVPDQPTRRTNVQTTFDTVRLRGVTTR